jgi:hypothetical protein
LHLVHEEDPEAEEQDEREDVGEDREEARAARALDLRLDVLAGEQVDELGLRVAHRRIAGRVRLAVLLLDVDRVRLLLERDRLDRRRLVLDLGDELVVGRGLLRGRAADQALGEEREHDHDQDRERRTAEETPHLSSPSAIARREGPLRVMLAGFAHGRRSGSPR